MPTVQGTDDFDHAIDSGYYTDGFFGTPTAVTSPLYQSQPKSLSIVTDGGNVGVRHNITGTPTFGWVGFPFQAEDYSASIHGVHSFGVAAGPIASCYLSTSGLFVTCGGVDGSVFAISLNTWYWVEMIMDVSTGTRAAYLRVGGVDASDTSVASAASTISWSQLISFAGDPTGETSFYGMWKWGSATSSTDWLGEPSANAIAWVRA